MDKNVLLHVDFNQLAFRNSVIEMLKGNLRDESDTSKPSLKESLALIQKGNKVPYGSANQLLLCILRSLRLVDDFDVDETFQDSEQVEDNTIQGPTSGASTSEEANETSENLIVQNEAEKEKEKTPKYGKKVNPKREENPKGDVCRFYANGRCKYNVECRFQHPKICPKFRQNGDCEVKGCGGDCEFFHPNVCRNSLKDKTCPYTVCRFFHLKGTKTTEKKTGTGKSDSPNWRVNQQGNTGGGIGQNNGPKNQQKGLSQKSKKKKGPILHRKPDKTQAAKPEQKVEYVTKEEKNHLGQTLEAIMRRLDAIEQRPRYFAHPGSQLLPQNPVQPLLSPAVPRMGSQTQMQWGSPLQWTQLTTQ